MIIESVILSITAITVGSFWLVERITKAHIEEDDKFDPAIVKAKRAAIEKKRAILLARREEYIKNHTPGKAWNKTNWDGAAVVDNQLIKLADEEAKIPMLEDEK